MFGAIKTFIAASLLTAQPIALHDYGAIGGWRISHSFDDDTCVMVGQYDGGRTTVILNYIDDFNLDVAVFDDKIPTDKNLPLHIVFIIDQHVFRAPAVNMNLYVDEVTGTKGFDHSFAPEAFLKLLGQSQGLVFQKPNGEIMEKLSLPNVRLAVAMLDNCYRRVNLKNTI